MVILFNPDHDSNGIPAFCPGWSHLADIDYIGKAGGDLRGRNLKTGHLPCKFIDVRIYLYNDWFRWFLLQRQVEGEIPLKPPRFTALVRVRETGRLSVVITRLLGLSVIQISLTSPIPRSTCFSFPVFYINIWVGCFYR